MTGAAVRDVVVARESRLDDEKRFALQCLQSPLPFIQLLERMTKHIEWRTIVPSDLGPDDGDE